jgi:hypothetical protein
MEKGSSGPDPALPSGADDGEATPAFLGPEPVTRAPPADSANPPRPWWEAAPAVGPEPVSEPPSADAANPPPQPWWEAATVVPDTVSGPPPAHLADPPPQPWAEAATVVPDTVSGPPPAHAANPLPQPWWEAASAGSPETVTGPPAADPVNPSPRPWAEAAAVGPETVTGPPADLPPQPSSDVVRYGPGVPASAPASLAGLQAERLWRTGPLPEPPRRRGTLRRLLGSALTVALLAAAGVVLYLRFHHAPFHVTGVAIVQQAKTGCGVDVTGRITTDGAAGTVSYQWVFRPQRQPPHPLSESVVAGQNVVYVTVRVEGQGHGSASEMVTLQVLGPDTASASTAVVVSC